MTESKMESIIDAFVLLSSHTIFETTISMEPWLSFQIRNLFFSFLFASCLSKWLIQDDFNAHTRQWQQQQKNNISEMRICETVNAFVEIDI